MILENMFSSPQLFYLLTIILLIKSSGLLVVSSAENNPADTLLHMGQQLQQLQNVTPAKLPKWFCHGVLKYCVLLHDAADGNNDKVETIFETMKSTYGSNHCFLLKINSRPPGQIDEASHLPDPWSQFLIRQLDSQVI